MFATLKVYLRGVNYLCYDEAVLTAHEAASYLNAGPEHLEAIRAEVFESKYAS